MTRPDKDSQDPVRRRKKTARRWFLFLLPLLIIAPGLLWMLYKPAGPSTRLQPATEPGAGPAPHVQPSPPAEKKTAAGPGKQPTPGQPAVRKPPDRETIPDSQQEIQASVEQVRNQLTPRECGAVADRLHTFFTGLDNKEYIREFRLDRPAQEYFLALGAKLLDNPPVVARESDDLYTILTNMAHFFRIIGSRNIVIMKTIMHRERAGMEDVLADLYLWSVNNTCHSDIFPFAASLEKVYEYAGFFLNTLGGRSYLFRRESGTRLLVNYYSVLVIDRANREGGNRHGIDLARILPLLTREIEATNQLIYRETYLDNLYDLMEKYPAPEPVQDWQQVE
ncbi:MAG TPA: hypothetical protein ENI89_07435 [Desulfobulbus sp.]|nr:hypothetical protein [Desulfobulbus sp.]